MQLGIGSFTLVRNEIRWIVPHILNVLPHLDQMVFFDGHSEDGTLQAIRGIASDHPHGRKIKLVPGKDPANLRNAYVEMFNECMWSLDTDFAVFLHPDMYVQNPEQFAQVKKSDAIALYTHMESYAGEPGGQLYRIEQGRGELWKNIYRLKKPNLGAHYHGWYGAGDEDVYFKHITGSDYQHHGQQMDRYPYSVEDSGLHIMHFSDVRTFNRRIGRMVTSLINQGHSHESAQRIAAEHPRVTLKEEHGFKFVPAEYPAQFKEAVRA